MIRPFWINQAWHWSCRREGMRFQQATSNVRETQAELLRRIIRRNRQTDYGTQYQFPKITGIDDFRDRVPVARYDSLLEYIARIGNGEKNVLTADDIERFVPTGGNTGGVKLVPYTAQLKRDFQRAIAAWIWSTFRSCPEAMHGRAYWSVTPMASSREKSPGGSPIGFERDSQYLGLAARWFAEQLILPPPQVGKIRAIENARYANLFYLFASSDLALISVWSPTFLIALLNRMEDWMESICRDIWDGAIRLPHRDSADDRIELRSKPDPRRAKYLLQQFQSCTSRAELFQRCWPQLNLLSCWGDGNAAFYLTQLRGLFPSVRIQPKGLLSTECVVSIPWSRDGHSILAFRSHFFEFLPVTLSGEPDDRRPVLAHELRVGSRYRVIVTTHGGFYRYDLRDIVEVTGHVATCPLLRFVGRMDVVSDLVGEKLNESHVRLIIEGVFQAMGLEQELYVFVAAAQTQSRYTLVLSGDTNLQTQDHARLVASIDHGLRTNPQYDLARKLEQLCEPTVRVVPFSGKELWRRYEDWQSSRGQRVGEIKMTVLDYRGTWREFLSRLDR